MNKIHLTTPMYYVNDFPHIGHAYTSLLADVTSRFMKMCGIETILSTGTDEHGSKIEKAAIQKGVAVNDYVDNVSNRFKLLAQKLNISYDYFIRTTDSEHRCAVINLWNVLMANNYIYLDKYSGWYSIRDEAFYDLDELIDGKSPTGSTVEWLDEPTYFFRLSVFREKLIQFYDENPDFICPLNKKNEVISFLKSDLKDLSISRITSKWGIKVPTDANHTIYVWLDALTSYLTALKYPQEIFDRLACKNTIHFIGKDILRFHAVYWPAFLIAADLPLPKKLAINGWWLNDGEKISKSLGNVIDPITLIEEFGLDQVRYFFLREVPFGADGNFIKSSLVRRVNSELSNNIGNLIQRTIVLIEKNCFSVIPEYHNINDVVLFAYKCVENFKQMMFAQRFSEALEIVLSVSSRANEYIDINKPWVDNDKMNMKNTLYNLLEVIRCIALFLRPFIPISADKILDIISIPTSGRTMGNISEESRIKPGILIGRPNIIFRRIVI